MSSIPTQVSESVRKRNPHLYPAFSGDILPTKNGGSESSVAAVPTQAGAPRVKKRIRQSDKPKLNVLETEFEKKLKADYEGFTILAQAIRLELATGLWYKPDFFIPAGHVRHADWDKSIAYEVKGPRAFRGGFENLKFAARTHGKWCKFFLVWKDKVTGEWQRQEVLP